MSSPRQRQAEFSRGQSPRYSQQANQRRVSDAWINLSMRHYATQLLLPSHRGLCPRL